MINIDYLTLKEFFNVLGVIIIVSFFESYHPPVPFLSSGTFFSSKNSTFIIG